MTLEYAAQEYVAGGQKEIKLVYPAEGSYLAPEGMFIIKGAKNAQAAQALYEGLLSKEAQEAQLVKNFRRPTRSDVAVASLTTLPDLASIKIFPISQEAAAQEYEAVVAAWGPGGGQGEVRKNSADPLPAPIGTGAGVRTAARPSGHPSASTSWRPQRAASCGSCVTSTSVAPCSRCRSNIRSITFSPVAASRLPVGSSANSRSGFTTKARASDTRCCSPPDSVRG